MTAVGRLCCVGGGPTLATPGLHGDAPSSKAALSLRASCAASLRIPKRGQSCDWADAAAVPGAQRVAGGNVCLGERERDPFSSRRRRRGSQVRCAGGGAAASGGGEGGGGGGGSTDKKADGLVELPLFPLPLVLFPGAVLPLQIFEYRYRILMHTLLQTDLRFGVVYSGKEQGSAAAIGCVGEVIKHERLPDDRYFLVCRGQERFRVVDIVRSRPYLVGRVAWLEDRPSGSLDLDLDLGSASEQQQGSGQQGEQEVLAGEVETLLKDVIRLSNKMSGRGEQEAPPDLRKAAFPTPFSFWVASTFEGAPSEQQALLELEDTAERLRRERDTLRNTLNYLTAATAVKDVFSSTPDS